MKKHFLFITKKINNDAVIMENIVVFYEADFFYSEKLVGDKVKVAIGLE